MSARMNARSVHRVRDGVPVCACATTTVGFRVLNTPNSTDRVVVSRLSRRARRRRRRRRRRAPTHGLLINPRFTHEYSTPSGVATDRYRSIDRSRPRDRSRYRSIELRRHVSTSTRTTKACIPPTLINTGRSSRIFMLVYTTYTNPHHRRHHRRRRPIKNAPTHNIAHLIRGTDAVACVGAIASSSVVVVVVGR